VLAAIGVRAQVGTCAEPADSRSGPLPAEGGAAAALDRLIEIGRALSGATATNAMLERALREAARALDPRADVVRVRDQDSFLRAWRRHSWGLGIRTAWSNGQHVVVAVLSHGPAAGKLQPGDLLDRVAGRFVTGIAPDQWTSWLSGSTGPVSIVVVRPQSRATLEVSLQPGWVAPEVGEVRVLPRGVHWVKLMEVREGAADLVLTAWTAASSNRTPGVVLDLREAAGLDLHEAARIAAAARPARAKLFELETLYPTQERSSIASPSSPLSNAAPLIVLHGPQTSDAAEVLAAALAGGTAPVIRLGRPTAGLLCRYQFVSLGGDWLAWLPTRRLYVEGRMVEGPLRPDLEPALRTLPGNERPAAASAGLNPKRRASPEEEEDRRLREQIRGDAELEQAVDLLLAVRALGMGDAQRR